MGFGILEFPIREGVDGKGIVELGRYVEDRKFVRLV